MSDLRDAALSAKAWPFEEARRVLKRYQKAPPDKGYVLFQTGYGPSGLPHIGTFGEVARTTMVMRAFREIGDIPTKLICFSDDLDGMRKVPGNIPNPEKLEPYLQMPLTSVPDPFGTHDSFGHHNNAILRRFLDTFGFEYEFYSATEFYRSGRFDSVLMRAAEKYDEIMQVMLASLREERRQSYSIFLPIHPDTGRVLYVPMKHVDAAKGTITFDDQDGVEHTLPVTGGNVKLQWKPDFGARWAALGVDFEMYGKDHSTNTAIYDKICRILGHRAPEHFSYELFLDENGHKISKTSGNGVSIDEWLTYANTESLSYFMYLKPKTAKRMHFDVIPRAEPQADTCSALTAGGADAFNPFKTVELLLQDSRNALLNDVWGGRWEACTHAHPCRRKLRKILESKSHHGGQPSQKNEQAAHHRENGAPQEGLRDRPHPGRFRNGEDLAMKTPRKASGAFQGGESMNRFRDVWV